MKRLTGFVVCLVVAAPAAVHAAAPAFPPYPPVQNTAAVREWIAAQTDLQPSEITIIDGGAVYGLPASPDNHDVGGVSTRVVREEVVDAALAARRGGRSSRAIVAFDCAHKQYGITSAMVFPGTNLSGAGRPISSAAWLAASPVYLFDLAGAVCAADQPALAPATPAPVAAQTPSIRPAAAPVEVPAPQAVARPSPLAAAPKPAAGSVWVQAGAFASAALAEAQWSALRARLGSELSHRLEPAPTAGLTRLLIGPFRSGAAAAGTCGRLKALGVACFVRR